MAKSIEKNADPSTKYFLAILKKECDFIELSTVNIDINSDIKESIQKISTDLGQEFIEKVREILKNIQIF